MMHTFTMRKGFATVTFTAGGDTILLNGRPVTADEMNAKYRRLRDLGFHIVETPKTEAPKEPEAPKTREEALTEKYGDKTARQQYMRTKKYLEGAWRRGILKNRPELKGKEFHDAVMLGVNNDLKKWEANGRPDIIKKLGR